jgi:hypothetical protein
MKRIVKLMSSYKSPAILLLGSELVFASCKKDKTEYTQPPAAGFMAFNLSLDKPSVGFSLSGNNFGNTPLGYAAYTGVYAPIYVGNREVRSFDYSNGSTIAISNMDFKDSSYYSAFLLGANGAYRNQVVEDNYTDVKPASGKAWVRYVNAIPDSVSTLSVTMGEANETAAYGSVSPFRQVNAGTLSLAVNNGSNINASRSINVEENKIYTVLFVGLPGQTDSTKAVSIRYIQNGTATE